MAVLPDAHVEANPDFAKVTRTEDKTHYDQEEAAVVVGGTGAGSPRYEKTEWQSKEELAALLGISEDEVEKRVGDRIEKQEGKGKALYRVKKVAGKEMSQSALHEIGHAVDQMIGGRTELVYGLAGWKKYGEADFDAWVDEMNGWAGANVEEGDRHEIRDAFRHRMNGNQSIEGPAGSMADMVTKDHPLRKSKNHGSFLVKTAVDSASPFHYRHPTVRGSRMFVMSNYYQHYFSCDPKLIPIAPRPYSLFAPEEFFADCYAEYYREYNGTPDTEDRKGGNLPAWVKVWFDKNVDRIGHDPP